MLVSSGSMDVSVSKLVLASAKPTEQCRTQLRARLWPRYPFCDRRSDCRVLQLSCWSAGPCAKPVFLVDVPFASCWAGSRTLLHCRAALDSLHIFCAGATYAAEG